MNWRDIRHPLAGGAEVYTHEVAKRLAARGHEVVLATSRPAGLPPEEEIDGVRIIRAGGTLTVYLKARDTYHRLRREGWRPDIVIDEINTVPFLTPRYVEEPIVALIHQLCRECWKYAVHPLAQPPGWWLEKKLHGMYAKATHNGKISAVITVSQSTKNDLIELGYPPDKIHIVPNGVDWELYADCANTDKDELVAYVGRITPYKKLEDLLKAWSIVERETDAQLVVAGRPNPRYLQKLTHLAQKLGLKRATFKTNITQQEKKATLAKAKILAYTSTREGWGQTILEAAACGTPTIAYDVPGLRDAVRHTETGILVEPGNVEQLARTVIWLLSDKTWYKLSRNTHSYVQNYSWDTTTRQLLEVFNSVN